MDDARRPARGPTWPEHTCGGGEVGEQQNRSAYPRQAEPTPGSCASGKRLAKAMSQATDRMPLYHVACPALHEGARLPRYLASTLASAAHSSGEADKTATGPLLCGSQALNASSPGRHSPTALLSTAQRADEASNECVNQRSEFLCVTGVHRLRAPYSHCYCASRAQPTHVDRGTCPRSLSRA